MNNVINTTYDALFPTKILLRVKAWREARLLHMHTRGDLLSPESVKPIETLLNTKKNKFFVSFEIHLTFVQKSSVDSAAAFDFICFVDNMVTGRRPGKIESVEHELDAPAPWKGAGDALEGKQKRSRMAMFSIHWREQ